MSEVDKTITYLIDSIEVTADDYFNMEKEAVAPLVAGVGRALLPAAKNLVRPLINSIARAPGAQKAGQAVAGSAAGQFTKAKQWGNAIAKDWTASGAAGKGLVASTSSALQTGMKVSPGLTAGAIATPAFMLGNSGDNAKNKNLVQPGTIMIRANENECGINKQALLEDQDPLDLMIKGIISGAAIGAGLALNSKFKGVKLRSDEYLDATKGLRSIGDSVTPFYDKGMQNLQKTRTAPVEAITDIRLQKLFRSTLDDITKYIGETKKNLPQPELADFRLKMQEAYNSNKVNIPLGVRDEIWEIIERI